MANGYYVYTFMFMDYIIIIFRVHRLTGNTRTGIEKDPVQNNDIRTYL